MFKKAKGFLEVLHRSEEGSYMVEMALVLIGVALTVYAAASGLSNDAIVPTYNSIATELESVEVPDLTP